jgi:hypothetical protein
MRNMKSGRTFSELILFSMRWRRIDGVVLLLAAGAFGGLAASLYGGVVF